MALFRLSRAETSRTQIVPHKRTRPSVEQLIAELQQTAASLEASVEAGTGAPRPAAGGRLLSVLRLAEEQPSLAEVAPYNPVTYVLEMARQATVVGLEPSLEHTLPGLAALAGLATFLGTLAMLGLRRMGR